MRILKMENDEALNLIIEKLDMIIEKLEDMKQFKFMSRRK